VQNEISVNLPSLNPLVQRVQPAVVNISAQVSAETSSGSDQSADRGDGPASPFDDFLKKFFENRGMPHAGREAVALGSGFMIDAPINRGNSGGPTFNLHGEVIGINTAIYSPSGGSVGIGFALPSNTANSVIQQIREKGHVTRGWLGVAIQGITPNIAKSLGMDPDRPTGALVASV